MADRADSFQRIIEARETLAELQSLVTPAALRAERDARIFGTKEAFFASRSDNDAALEIERVWGRYEADVWPRDKSSKTCPPRLVGKLEGALWEIMQLSPRALSGEYIRKIIGRHRRLK